MKTRLLQSTCIAMILLLLCAFSLLRVAFGQTGRAVIVVPALDVHGMVERFEKTSEAAWETDEIKRLEKKYMDMNRNGETRWPSEDWLKLASYYQGLDTETLAKECFSKPTFYIEMALYADHEEAAFVRLKVMHNGFAELFERPDMWKGILAVYGMLTSKIYPGAERGDVLFASATLDSLRELYFYYRFNAQVTGREKVFLDANVEALKAFRRFANSSKSMQETPFYRSPFVVASVALMLQQRTNPRNFDEMIPQLSAVCFSQEQRLEDIKYYLDLAIAALEKGMDTQ